MVLAIREMDFPLLALKMFGSGKENYPNVNSDIRPDIKLPPSSSSLHHSISHKR